MLTRWQLLDIDKLSNLNKRLVTFQWIFLIVFQNLILQIKLCYFYVYYASFALIINKEENGNLYYVYICSFMYACVEHLFTLALRRRHIM